MPCLQTLSTFIKDCEANLGGLKKIVLGLFDGIATKALDAAGNQLATFTLQNDYAVYAFPFKKGQASLASSPQYNDANEYTGEEITLAVNFTRQDTSKRAAIAGLSVNDLFAFVKDNNDQWWFVGYDAPLTRTGGDSTTGSNASDTNAYGVSLSNQEKGLPYGVAAAIVEALNLETI